MNGIHPNTFIVSFDHSSTNSKIIGVEVGQKTKENPRDGPSLILGNNRFESLGPKVFIS